MLSMARRRAGFSQRELSRRTGIPQATISRIENRVVSPTFDTLEPLISACGMAVIVSEKTSEGVDRTLLHDAAPANAGRAPALLGRCGSAGWKP